MLCADSVRCGGIRLDFFYFSSCPCLTYRTNLLVLCLKTSFLPCFCFFYYLFHIITPECVSVYIYIYIHLYIIINIIVFNFSSNEAAYYIERVHGKNIRYILIVFPPVVLIQVF